MLPTLLAAAALLTSSGSAKTFLSPSLDWLDDARFSWDFRGTPYAIDCHPPSNPYGRRYLEFRLIREASKGTPQLDFDEQFNFWSTNRLISLDVVNQSDIRQLHKGRMILQKEKAGFLSVTIPSPRPGYNLYVNVSPPSHSSRGLERELLRILSRLRIVRPGPKQASQ